MTERNIAGFPQRGVDLALERRIAEVARLAERVAELMETEDSPMSIRELFDRIESASADLSEIGMVLYGADRLKVQELCFNVRDMIDRIRSILGRS